MKLSFRVLAKFALLLVIIGFMMPVACNRNGFEIAEYMMKMDDYVFNGLLTYLLFISALAGVGIGVYLLMNKRLNPTIDWIVIAVCIASGLIVYFSSLQKNVNLQNGAYVILVGWIAAVVLQVFSKMKNE